MLFIKGSVAEPRCGFSARAIELLEKYSIQFGAFDILSDNEVYKNRIFFFLLVIDVLNNGCIWHIDVKVREGLKALSDWNTYPQLYVDGKLVGGIDIIKEMDENNTLAQIKESTNQSLSERLNAVIK